MLMIIVLHVISMHALSFSETKNINIKLLNINKKVPFVLFYFGMNSNFPLIFILHKLII